MKLIGKKVTHKKFGSGTIVDVETDRVQVDFEFAVKSFVYPDSFGTFIQISDKPAREYIRVEIDRMNRLKTMEQERKDREKLKQTYIKKLKIKGNSQAVFGMQENHITDVLENWCVFTGNYLSGSNKGTPRTPKNLNMNSACLLTMKPEGGKEADRLITGMFMVQDDFIGADCKDGVIHAHEKYRLVWEPENEELYFWNYFSDEAKLNRWGNCEMKYIPNTLIKKIVEDMIRLTPDRDGKEDLYEFYDYFREMNHM